MTELTAVQAAHIAKLNPYNREKTERRISIMKGINERALLGQVFYSRTHEYEPLPRETVDWLVSLGYMIFHSKPFQYRKEDKPQHSWSIYWAGTVDLSEPFSPGERFSPDYNDDPLWKQFESKVKVPYRD